MSRKQALAGTGGGGEIAVNLEDIDQFAEQAQAIVSIFYHEIQPEIERLSALGYYTDGQAADAFSKYKEALEKMLDVGDFYQRATMMLTLVSESMRSQDQALATSFNGGGD